MLNPISQRDKRDPPRQILECSNATGALVMAISYRRAELADILAVSGLRQPSEAGGAATDRMLRYLTGGHHPQQALPPRAMWVAAIDGVPIGYVAGHLTRRFDCDGELQWIYVVREHRRSHVATELVRLLAEWFTARGASRICVDVGDDAARPFYRARGAVDLNRHWMVWNDISQLPALNNTHPRK
jgi:GNAT superfamily N-acetyltransferase